MNNSGKTTTECNLGDCKQWPLRELRLRDQKGAAWEDDWESSCHKETQKILGKRQGDFWTNPFGCVRWLLPGTNKKVLAQPM